MTAADAWNYLYSSWPILIVVVPGTWGVAKLYYDREIRLLKQQLEVAEAEGRRLREGSQTGKLTAPNDHPPTRETLMASAMLEPPAARMRVTQPMVLKLQRDARAVLAAIRHLRAELAHGMEAPKPDTVGDPLWKEHALKNAALGYQAIKAEVITMRDRMLVVAPPMGRVRRAINANDYYTTPITPESLEGIEKDLSLLCLSLRADEHEADR